MYFLVIVVNLAVNTSAVNCLERLGSDVTCYVSSGTLNSAILAYLLTLSPPIKGPMASPGFVARRGKDGNYVMGIHGELQGRVQQLLDD